jgi:hypothetical protein
VGERRSISMSDDGPNLNFCTVGFVDAEAELAADNAFWRKFMVRILEPTEADWEAGKKLPAADYAWNGRRWRRVTLLTFPQWELPDLDVCDDFSGNPEQPETATGEAKGFVIKITAAEVTVAIPND